MSTAAIGEIENKILLDAITQLEHLEYFIIELKNVSKRLEIVRLNRNIMRVTRCW